MIGAPQGVPESMASLPGRVIRCFDDGVYPELQKIPRIPKTKIRQLHWSRDYYARNRDKIIAKQLAKNRARRVMRGERFREPLPQVPFEQILADRASGMTFREMGIKYAMSYNGARKRYLRALRETD